MTSTITKGESNKIRRMRNICVAKGEGKSAGDTVCCSFRSNIRKRRCLIDSNLFLKTILAPLKRLLSQVRFGICIQAFYFFSPLSLRSFLGSDPTQKYILHFSRGLWSSALKLEPACGGNSETDSSHVMRCDVIVH